MRCRLHLSCEKLYWSGTSATSIGYPRGEAASRRARRRRLGSLLAHRMDFAKGLGKGARSKFRARGQPTKETAMEEPELELLAKRPATNSSSNGSSSPPESLPIRLPENERIKRYMDMAASMADGQNVP